MREAAFVKRNKDQWAVFENALSNKTDIAPDVLSDLYIEITDHLSYAKTFYAGSNTEFYLNGLASQAHRQIYKTKRESKNRIISFWKTEFPTMFFHHRRELLIAFLVFAFFTFHIHNRIAVVLHTATTAFPATIFSNISYF